MKIPTSQGIFHPSDTMEYAGGIAGGLASSIAIAPVMMIVDTAIIRSQFQKTTLRRGKKLYVRIRLMDWPFPCNDVCGWGSEQRGMRRIFIAYPISSFISFSTVRKVEEVIIMSPSNHLPSYTLTAYILHIFFSVQGHHSGFSVSSNEMESISQCHVYCLWYHLCHG